MGGSAKFLAVLAPQDGGKVGKLDIQYGASERVVDAFTDNVCEAVLDGRLEGAEDFALGFVCAMNALLNRRVDFSDPVGAVKGALADIEDVSDGERRISDCLAAYCERAARR